MEDKNYIQALMDAPSRDEHDVSMKQAVLSDKLREKWKAIMQWFVNVWKSLRRVYNRIRKNGTAREKRVMWRLMHPPSHHRRRGRH